MKQSVEGNETRNAREQRSEQTGHTPTPWKIENGEGGEGWSINPLGLIDAESGFGLLKEEDAKFIVRAVNSHEELLEALKSMVAQYDGDDGDARYAPRRFAKEKAIIAKVEGK